MNIWHPKMSVRHTLIDHGLLFPWPLVSFTDLEISLFFSSTTCILPIRCETYKKHAIIYLVISAWILNKSLPWIFVFQILKFVNNFQLLNHNLVKMFVEFSHNFQLLCHARIILWSPLKIDERPTRFHIPCLTWFINKNLNLIVIKIIRITKTMSHGGWHILKFSSIVFTLEECYWKLIQWNLERMIY